MAHEAANGIANNRNNNNDNNNINDRDDNDDDDDGTQPEICRATKTNFILSTVS